MSKYHTIVGVDPSGYQELSSLEFMQLGASENNIIYLYVSGDSDIPHVDYDNLPVCASHDEDYCECMYGESLVQRVIEYYTELGFNIEVISFTSLVSSLS